MSSDPTSALQEEQGFLDRALARHGQLLKQLEAETVTDAARAGLLRRRHRELSLARDGLVFGRLDGADGAVRRIGRIGLQHEDERAEPLVVDWRAPAARPFYTATPLSPEGQNRRRHIQVEQTTVVGVNDEPLENAEESALVGEGALLAALDRRRTGQMTTAIATLQREQDDIIRADADGPLIVQGGPGTGKTVVALHRVAYLLFTHARMSDQAVLVLGPSSRFLDYIAQVLPALGETAVVSTTCDALIPGVLPTRTESREISELKGRALWQDAITSYVTSLFPPVRDLTVRWEGDDHVVPAGKVRRLLTAVSGRPYHQARRVFSEQFRDVLTDIVVEHRETLLAEVESGFEDILARFGGVDAAAEAENRLTEDEIDRIRDQLDLTNVLKRWWPDLDPKDQLDQLLSDKDLLRQHAPQLTDEEITLITAEPKIPSPSDIPLIDAVAELLGEIQVAQPDGEFVADRARRQRGWIYGHVVIDEAQELSEMQWQMIVRRCPTRSITAVGDIDQAEASHQHRTWAEAVGATFGKRWNAAELTICYRTPREVMELTGPVLARAGSLSTPARAVRSAQVQPWEKTITADKVAETAAEHVKALKERWSGGTVGVIAPPHRITALKNMIRDVPVITATESKGLEWDATLLIDPDGIAAGPRGWNQLYVALTRCTQELGQLRVPPGSFNGAETA